MKNNITLDVDHPNKVRMEYFLNNVNEKLKQVAFDWSTWKLSQSIIGGFQFKNENQSVVITIIFSDSYEDANQIGKENSLPLLPTAKWSVNGDLLFLVESADQNKVSEILGLFAGEE